MKKVIILLSLLMAATVMAQERSTVTVKKGDVSNGMIILTVHQTGPAQPGKASFFLQCNKGQSGCVVPPPGNCLMVRLPENWGMYACTDVDLYPTSADPQTSEKIGEYCLIDK